MSAFVQEQFNNMAEYFLMLAGGEPVRVLFANGKFTVTSTEAGIAKLDDYYSRFENQASGYSPILQAHYIELVSDEITGEFSNASAKNELATSVLTILDSQDEPDYSAAVEETLLLAGGQVSREAIEFSVQPFI